MGRDVAARLASSGLLAAQSALLCGGVLLAVVTLALSGCWGDDDEGT